MNLKKLAKDLSEKRQVVNLVRGYGRGILWTNKDIQAWENEVEYATKDSADAHRIFKERVNKIIKRNSSPYIYSRIREICNDNYLAFTR